MKPELLLVTQIYPPTMAELDREFTVHRLWEAADAPAYLREHGAKMRAVVSNSLAGLSRAQLDALSAIEIAAFFSTGVGTLDMAEARRRGIVVANVPDAIHDSVADLAFGLIITTMRRIAEADRYVRAGKWTIGPFAMGRELAGKTCGIVGFGRIGQRIAARVAPFGMKVAYQGPRRKPDFRFDYYADVKQLAAAADCLVVTCPATPETRHLINAPVLEALGPDGYLINVARGSIVDEAALAAALASGRIAGAGLDVFADEPQVPEALRVLDNVVLLPHIGSSTREVREERGRKLMANLRAHFARQPVPYTLK